MPVAEPRVVFDTSALLQLFGRWTDDHRQRCGNPLLRVPLVEFGDRSMAVIPPRRARIGGWRHSGQFRWEIVSDYYSGRKPEGPTGRLAMWLEAPKPSARLLVSPVYVTTSDATATLLRFGTGGLEPPSVGVYWDPGEPGLAAMRD